MMSREAERRERASMRMKAAHASPAFRVALLAAKRGVDVPAWAESAGLTEDYIAIARVHDEFAAARVCRRLLAEMRGAP